MWRARTVFAGEWYTRRVVRRAVRRVVFRGLTLVETLVVTSVLMTLVGLLVPVFLRAQARAHREACSGRLRQVALAASLYRDDNDGAYPPAGPQDEMVAPGSGSYSTSSYLLLRSSLSSYVGGGPAFDRLDHCTLTGHRFAHTSGVTGALISGWLGGNPETLVPVARREPVFIIGDANHTGMYIAYICIGDSMHTLRREIPGAHTP